MSRCHNFGVPCFARPEGYACDCPNSDAPKTSDYKWDPPSGFDPNELADCDGALIHACATDCEGPAGRCSFGDDDRYHCECSVGITATSDAWLCPNALKRCEPACESDTGACYGDPQGWKYACQCQGAADWHVTAEPKIGVPIANCFGQLADFCGGSAP